MDSVLINITDNPINVDVNINNVSGSNGTNGTNGNVWRDGSGAPSNSLGANNDYYLNDANGDVYLKTAGVYNIVANIKGAPGNSDVISVNGQVGVVVLTKTDISLSNVDNTSDINKPVSTATQTALNLKVDKTTTVNGNALSGNVTLTKSDIGLSNVVNADTTTTANITDSTNKRFVTDAQLVVVGNTSGTNTGDETTSTLGATINGATTATPNDTDLVATVESSVVKKITWTNVKAFLKTYFDTIYTTTSAVSSQITTALSGYATQAYVTSQGYITNVVSALGYTPEDVANKSSSYTASSTTTYANTKALVDGLATKQNVFDFPLVDLTPSISQTITAGYGTIVPYRLIIPSGFTITLELNAILQIT